MSINFFEEKPVFFCFMHEKDIKGKLNLHDLTEDIMAALWVDELVDDRDIAELFDTSVEMIREIRHGYGIDNASCAKEYLNNAAGWFKGIGASIMNVGKVELCVNDYAGV